TDAFTPSECLQQAVKAERIGFDSLWVEDHFIAMPGGTQCNFAWTVMSSALQATERVPFFTGVTAPIMRYHPAIVAQAFATMGAMYPGRVGIGVGTAEPPNEMAVYGGEWPSNATRLDMLDEALTVMNRLWTSAEPVSFAGTYYTLNNAMVLTKPEEQIPVYVSAIGPRAAEVAGRLGDHLISFANNPQYVKEELFPTFEAAAREAGKDPNTMERVGHFAYFYDPEQVIPLESIQQDAGTVSGGALSRAMSSGIVSIFHSAEDIITRIEELKQMGYDHIVVGNNTAGGPAKGIPLDVDLSLKIWGDVLPHVR
ncbi:MAG: LLM class flavin-dependent oxidoreductase, partial [Halobacteriota archaeon]